MNEPRLFSIVREADATGISGTGHVLDGVIFHTGQVVVCWRSNFGSITIFENWEAFENVHLKAHPENKAKVMFHD
ncbi:hypothetical protein GCM10008956_40350 [Deinococcus arenae]|uniref:Uncharacterized protein n=1 Tax=Deinococcus arenae TaxID=1452751 RepID=A0A8H9GT60_9DEIO|nr:MULTISPECIES: hypothetical protein [Deinococcus]GGM60619.1 hypothetical protein GCM10008956_40350 [Deinococcus arenae]